MFLHWEFVIKNFYSTDWCIKFQFVAHIYAFFFCFLFWQCWWWRPKRSVLNMNDHVTLTDVHNDDITVANIATAIGLPVSNPIALKIVISYSISSPSVLLFNMKTPLNNYQFFGETFDVSLGKTLNSNVEHNFSKQLQYNLKWKQYNNSNNNDEQFIQYVNKSPCLLTFCFWK